MLKDLNDQQTLLADFMSEISEKCYCAGWMKDLEYVLWDAVVDGERRYGQDTITSNDIKTLKKLSQQCNCWIIFDDKKQETAIGLDSWKDKFHEYIALNFDRLKNF